MPALLVYEAPEAVSMVLDDHRGRWSPDAARWTATVSLAALTPGAGPGMPTYQVAVITAVACSGLLLRLAPMFSGLAVLDDRRSSGEAVARGDVLASVAGAYRSPTTATVPVAAIPALVLSIEQPEHVRARLRGITNRFEAIAVVVLARRSPNPLPR
ncbi:hypothetical protein HNR06_002529 [Nocardiopsis arvandica]|uniref:Uncharacterized protein n=1 Tax=Nocardiopsis sinuspersici TaxID=501010 RepID=A0A7Y9XEL9_9ACTN|nr:hypothetical protein [Nocardiopsis sinuspersici]NYH52940.1 hypothetical protein [Nocardiopsis sinuspersici]